MKRINAFILLVLLLVACGGLNSPKKVATAFTENMAHGKIEEAKQLATGTTAQMIDFISGMGRMPVEPSFKFHYLRDSIVGDEAWVFYDNAISKKEEYVHLVKIEGKWKVHMENKK